MSINVEFNAKITPSDACAALKKAPGIRLLADLDNYMTPIEVAGEDAVYVSRLRKDPSCDNGLNMWVVADNLRKGAALNAVQILELLIARKLI
jgi:aspartate-semialdehyde dehydrogenase